MFKKIAAGLSILGVVGYVTYAYAAGLFPDFPVVGGASYCAGSSSTAIGSIIGSITGCPNTVPAGPTIVTGNEQIPADTRLSSGANPQTVLLSLASLNSLPLQFVTVVNPNSPSGISAANNSGGVVYSNTVTITSANITLPAAPIDGQQYAVSANRNITTLSVSAGGTAAMAGNVAPTTLSVLNSGSFGYRFIFNASSNSWFRLE